LSNATNSFKSRCSFAKATPIVLDQVEEDVHSLLRGEIRVVLLVGALRVGKTVKDLGHAFHGAKCSTARVLGPDP
jgi:hypothetical protein